MLQNPASSSDHKQKSSNEVFMEEALAKTGARNATNLTGETNEESNLKTKMFLANIRAFRAGLTINNSLRIKMDGWKLDTHSTIDDATGKLQIKGDDGNYRDASFQEKVVLEDNTQACSIGTTEDEIQMQRYLKGEIEHPPVAFKELAADWAKENDTIDPNNMTRENYNQFLSEEFPYHGAQMQYGNINVKLGYGADANDLLSQLSKDSKTDWDKVEAITETLSPTGRLSANPAIENGAKIAYQFTNTANPFVQEGLLKPTKTTITFDSTGPNVPTL